MNTYLSRGPRPRQASPARRKRRTVCSDLLLAPVSPETADLCSARPGKATPHGLVLGSAPLKFSGSKRPFSRPPIQGKRHLTESDEDLSGAGKLPALLACSAEITAGPGEVPPSPGFSLSRLAPPRKASPGLDPLHHQPQTHFCPLSQAGLLAAAPAHPRGASQEHIESVKQYPKVLHQTTVKRTVPNYRKENGAHDTLRYYIRLP